MRLITIGRGETCQIKFNSQYISTYHAELLLLDNGEILLTDKGSKNGTYINDQRLQPNKDIPVKRGDIIRFADQKLNWGIVPSINLDPAQVKAIEGIGTNFRNKHQIQGDSVSRFHATLKKMKDKKWYIQDHSTNGTTVNGQRIPSQQDYLLKRGDSIMCAGVPVKNPYGDKPNFNFGKIAAVLAIALLLVGIGYTVYKLTDDGIISETDMYEKYHSATCLVRGQYYYQVTVGDLDLDFHKLPKYISYTYNKDGELELLFNDEALAMPMTYSGTGFFISKDGKIATNLHIARPWLYDDISNELIDLYKDILSEFAARIDIKYLKYLDKVKIEGRLEYIGIWADGSYLSLDNLKQCHELIGHNNIEKDVAILQMDTKGTPAECAFIDISKAVVDDSQIKVGDRMYLIGFPGALGVAITNQLDIKSTGNGGTINKAPDKYKLGYNAATIGGASGSPVFNMKGQLIGVHNAGLRDTQGFNYGIKASHLVGLLEEIK